MTIIRVRHILYSLNKLHCTTASPVKNIENGMNQFSNVTKENQYEILSNVVTPLWNVDYYKQIYLKKKWSQSIINTIKTKHLPRVVTRLHSVIPSPEVTGYRNIDEFNINIGVDGSPKTVGLFVRTSDSVVCVPPLNLKIIKPNHIAVAEEYQNFIRKSPLKSCLRLNDGGCWRNVVVRSNQQGDILTIICAHPSGVPKDDIPGIKESLLNHFQLNSSLVKSLYLQLCPHSKCNQEQAPFMLVYGNSHLFESVDRYTFRISPGSFFEINTNTIQFLYESVLNLLNVSKNYTLLELNCGIGAFSIFASNSVRGCVGIDNSSQAIGDALFNANSNKINNCHFFEGSVEKKLKETLKELDSTLHIAAVINVGKIGISKEMIKMLRRCIQLKKLILISRKGDSPDVIRTVVDLCRPKFDLSSSFRLTDVQPIDMYPHTNYFDLIMLFQR